MRGSLVAGNHGAVRTPVATSNGWRVQFGLAELNRGHHVAMWVLVLVHNLVQVANLIE